MYKIRYYIPLFFFTALIFAQDQTSSNNESFNINDLKSGLLVPGLEFEFLYVGDFWSNVSANDKSIVYLDNFNLDLNLDLETLSGWKGGGFFFSILGNNGKDPNEQVGSVQGIDNIAAYSTWKIYQLYFTQELLDGKISMLAGLFDLNSEFDVRECSGVFINPSHGIGADYALTGQNGPSIFPTTSIAFRVLYHFNDNWNLRSAVFDGVPGAVNNPKGTQIVFDKNDGLLFTSELTYENEDSGCSKYSLGGWYYSGDFETLDEISKNGNMGMYFSGEQPIFRPIQDQSLNAFIRFGFSDSEINQVNSYFGAGLNYNGLFGREEDVIGLAVAVAHNNSNFISGLKNEGILIGENEYNIELTYYFSLLPNIKIQPDLQYVINPVEGNQSKNYFVAGTRVYLTF